MVVVVDVRVTAGLLEWQGNMRRAEATVRSVHLLVLRLCSIRLLRELSLSLSLHQDVALPPSSASLVCHFPFEFHPLEPPVDFSPPPYLMRLICIYVHTHTHIYVYISPSPAVLLPCGFACVLFGALCLSFPFLSAFPSSLAAEHLFICLSSSWMVAR